MCVRIGICSFMYVCMCVCVCVCVCVYVCIYLGISFFPEIYHCGVIMYVIFLNIKKKNVCFSFYC